MKPRILVTGGSGFVGGWVLRHFRDIGHEVISLDLKSVKIKGIESIIGDITDPETLDFPEIDYIIHCAGLLESSHPSGNMLKKVNIEGTKNVFLSGKDSSVRGFIFMSTVSAIGPHGSKKKPMTESTPTDPTDAYGQSKYDSEKILTELSNECGIPVWFLRPPVLYGEGMSPNSSAMRTFINVRKGRMPLVGKGEGTFNFLYIGNLMEAMNLLITKKPISGPYIVNEGPYTQLDIYDAISRRMKIDRGYMKIGKFSLWSFTILSMIVKSFIKGPPPMSWIKYRALTTDCWSVDHSKIVKAVGFKPIYSLETGIDRTCTHYGW